MSKPALVTIINPNGRCAAFGDYPVGVEITVTLEIAAYLASRGFVPVAAVTPAHPVIPQED
jgi:hypothetical protein